jgi:YD repeat-containing protein
VTDRDESDGTYGGQCIGGRAPAPEATCRQASASQRSRHRRPSGHRGDRSCLEHTWYDAAGRKLTETDPLGRVTTLTHDTVGNPKPRASNRSREYSQPALGCSCTRTPGGVPHSNLPRVDSPPQNRRALS